MPLQDTNPCSIPYKVLNVIASVNRGPRGILCTRGEKEYASIRQPTAACDNRLVKREAYDMWPWLLCIVRTIYFFHNATIFPA